MFPLPHISHSLLLSSRDPNVLLPFELLLRCASRTRSFDPLVTDTSSATACGITDRNSAACVVVINAANRPWRKWNWWSSNAKMDSGPFASGCGSNDAVVKRSVTYKFLELSNQTDDKVIRVVLKSVDGETISMLTDEVIFIGDEHSV